MLKRKLVVLLAVVAAIGIAIPAFAINLGVPVMASPSWNYLDSESDWLVWSGDYDLFSVTLGGDEQYMITLSGPSGTDFDLYLYDENGNLVASSTDYGSDETVYITPAWTGTFYIKVVSYDGSGSFTIRLYRHY